MALQIVPASTDYGDAYIPPDITLDITESDGLEFEGESNLYDSSDNLIRQDKFKGESSLQYTVPLIDAWHDMKDGGYKVDVNVSAEVPIPPTPISLIPSQSGTLTYNGSYQVPTFVNYNPEELQINGTDTAVDAGTYTVTFTPKQGYCWADGSVGAVSVQWKINKANNPMTLSDYTYSIEEKKQYVFTITINNKVGNVTYTNKEGATVNLTGNTLRFTVNGSLITKNIIIPITDEGNNNYYPVTQNFTIINNIPDETLGLHLLSSTTNMGTQNHYVWNRTNYSSVSTLPYTANGVYSCVVVYNNEIHLLGGSSSNTRKHYKWDGDAWVSVSTLPYDFDSGCAVVYNNELHILGGKDNYSTSSINESLLHYKWNGNNWIKLDDLPCSCIECTTALVYHDSIHLLRGYHIVNNRRWYHYKYQNNTWTKLNDLPSDLYYYADLSFKHSSVVYRDELYSDSSYYNKSGYLYKYNEDMDRFEKGISTQYGGSMVVFDNRIHKLGGGYYSNRHYVLEGSTWQRIEDIPYYFGNSHAIVAKNLKKNEPITTLPSQSNVLIFNGQTQTPTWNNYDATKMTIGGTLSSTDAGTFSATFTPKDGYCWSDESTEAKTITWTIGKAQFEIGKSSITMVVGETSSVILQNFAINEYDTPDISFNATTVSGQVELNMAWDSINVNNPTQCYAKIKVLSDGTTYGTKRITFTSFGNNNYESSTKIIDIIVKQTQIKLQFVPSSISVNVGETKSILLDGYDNDSRYSYDYPIENVRALNGIAVINSSQETTTVKGLSSGTGSFVVIQKERDTGKELQRATLLITVI